MFEIILMLIASHFICDYVLQGDAIALGKNRNIDPNKFGVHWSYWLTSHAITHGVGVGIVTGNVYLGLLETVLHWIIDFGKCEKWFGLHMDQFLHIASKLLIVGILFFSK